MTSAHEIREIEYRNDFISTTDALEAMAFKQLQRELVKGTILGDRIVCPGHQWAFNLETGYEAKKCEYQPVFDTRVEDGRILDDRRADPGAAAAVHRKKILPLEIATQAAAECHRCNYDRDVPNTRTRATRTPRCTG